VDDKQRRLGAELGLIPSYGMASYDGVLRDRTLTRFGRLLGTGPSTYLREPLTSVQNVLTQTASEQRARGEEARKRQEERRNEEERFRAALDRAERIRNRRRELEAQMGYQQALPPHQQDLEEKITRYLALEFGEEEAS
jgi:hypothetical protein